MTDQPTTEKTGFADMHEHGETVRSAYRQRIDALEAATQKRLDDEAEAAEDSTLESVDTELTEESKFVANPDVRKEVTSEEEFSAGLEDGEDDLEVTETPDVEGEEQADLGVTASSTKAEIVDALVEEKVASREELEGMTKAELVDRFLG